MTFHRKWMTAAVVIANLTIGVTAATAQKRYDPGSSDTEIKIGQTMPYSGPASAYATIGKAEAAYFRMINESGGIRGRKITLLSYDDGYSPTKTVEQVRKLGRLLGPRGLMPNPKVGTVTSDVASAVRDAKGGKIEYRVEKAGIVHARIGKVSFGEQALADNARALIGALVRQKPSTAKGAYLRSITVSSTMGPPVKIDPAQFMTASEEG